MSIISFFMHKIMKKINKQSIHFFSDKRWNSLEPLNNISSDIIEIYTDVYLNESFLIRLVMLSTKKTEFSNSYMVRHYGIYLDDIINQVKKHNEKFIKKHIDDSIFDNINGHSLDKEQRISVLKDAVSILTIAGAGSGKTLTICGKVKWLLERLKIDKNDILLLSYSSKSAEDLSKKIGEIADGMKVKTFHALGLELLRDSDNVSYRVDESFNAVVEKYFREYMKNKPEILRKILNYYGLYLANTKYLPKYSSYGDLFEELKKGDLTTLKDHLKRFSDKKETLKKELVRSYEELAIANYLFINGIDYEYESTYKCMKDGNEGKQYTPDFYLPQYDLYYEHYGIDENGNASQYDDETAKKYVSDMAWKRRCHKLNGTKCIETYSYEFNNNELFNNLEKRLKSNGVIFKPLSLEEVNNALNSIYEGQSFKSFINLIRTFISLYKARYSDETSFDKLELNRMHSLYEKRRALLFIDICKDVYRYYIEHLKKENKIDFDDMILKSIQKLKSSERYKYKYIIVDEFQDISYSRMKFLQELIMHGNSKLYAVGDDWQAIYRYSGCDVNIFFDFHKHFAYSEKCFITSTHRNSQELLSVVEPFIIANKSQFKKNVKSDKHIDNPIKIMNYENKYNSFMNILADISIKDPNANVMLLGRNNRDIEDLESTRFYRSNRENDVMISKDYPGLNIKFLTVHKSKGLEEDYVVIINADDDKYGFPNKVEDDGLLDLVLSSKEKYEYAEERRLWYVALTRTRTYTYILSSAKNPSIFVEEIKKKCEIMNPELLRDLHNPIYCPKCIKGRLVIRSNGGNFYGCSNYPYCKYTISEITQVAENRRCKKCQDFLVNKKGKYGPFYGCHSYPECNYTEEINY